jgi:hypothetical protein
MPDEHLSTWLLGQNPGARDGAMRALLSAPWSFLHHPAGTFEDHLTALEERLRVLEARLVGDLETNRPTVRRWCPIHVSAVELETGRSIFISGAGLRT